MAEELAGGPTATGLIISLPPLPPLPPSPHAVDLSPLEFVLGLMAVITFPVLIYAFIFTLRCPSIFTRSRDRPRRLSGEFEGVEVVVPAAAPASADVKTRKEAEGECPVCLSAFAEGEEVKQLSVCSHNFHAPCIDAWLSSHANCPVCRASIAVKKPPTRPDRRATRDSDDLQGLPDASSLV